MTPAESRVLRTIRLIAAPKKHVTRNMFTGVDLDGNRISALLRGLEAKGKIKVSGGIIYLEGS